MSAPTVRAAAARHAAVALRLLSGGEAERAVVVAPPFSPPGWAAAAGGAGSGRRTALDRLRAPLVALVQRQWDATVKADKGTWRAGLHGLAQRVLRRQEPQEAFLAGVPHASSALVVVAPPGTEDAVARELAAAAAGAQQRLHSVWPNLLGVVLVSPLGMLPVPNVPFYYFVWRAYTAYQAHKGARALEGLLAAWGGEASVAPAAPREGCTRTGCAPATAGGAPMPDVPCCRLEGELAEEATRDGVLVVSCSALGAAAPAEVWAADADASIAAAVAAVTGAPGVSEVLAKARFSLSRTS